MFILTKEPACCWWPVRWPGVAEDGSIVENEIEMKFIRHPRDRVMEIYKENTAAYVAAAEADPFVRAFGADTNVELGFVRDLAKDWRGIGQEVGAGVRQPLPFTDENIRALLNQPGFGDGFSRAHLAFMKAEPEIRRGNSKPSPAGGQATATGSNRPPKKRRSSKGR